MDPERHLLLSGRPTRANGEAARRNALVAWFKTLGETVWAAAGDQDDICARIKEVANELPDMAVELRRQAALVRGSVEAGDGDYGGGGGGVGDYGGGEVGDDGDDGDDDDDIGGGGSSGTGGVDHSDKSPGSELPPRPIALPESPGASSTQATPEMLSFHLGRTPPGRPSSKRQRKARELRATPQKRRRQASVSLVAPQPPQASLSARFAMFSPPDVGDGPGGTEPARELLRGFPGDLCVRDKDEDTGQRVSQSRQLKQLQEAATLEAATGRQPRRKRQRVAEDMYNTEQLVLDDDQDF